MAVIRPFRAVRPDPAAAPRVAAVPYDVVDTDEARALAGGNPLSFLHVSRAEIDLPSGTDPHDDIVYRAAAERYRALKRDAPFMHEAAPALYLYHLDSDGHGQTGIAACYSLAEYDGNVIKKHERTRKDKEDDRTRHIVELRAQTGPVFLAYRPVSRIDELARRVRSEPRAARRLHRAGWRAARDLARGRGPGAAIRRGVHVRRGAVHRRRTSPCRERRSRARRRARFRRGAISFSRVAFPSDQLRILPYNRVVRDLNGMTPEHFLGEVARTVRHEIGPSGSRGKGRRVDVRGGRVVLRRSRKRRRPAPRP